MTPQRENSTPRHKAGHALVPATPGPKTTLRSLGARALMLTAVTTPVLAAPFVLTSAAAPPDPAAAALRAAGAQSVDPFVLAERERRASRSSSARIMRTVTLEPRAVDHQWATAPLNVWARPGEKGERLGLVEAGTKVGVTGQSVGHWAEVLVGGKARWVNATYLAENKPVARTSAGGAAPAGGVSTAPCPDGSATESGLSSNAVTMFRAVCNAFPALTTYGGYDPHGEHADGRAVDFMTSGSTGDAIAEWARANAGALHIRTIIWSQHIWTPERSAEGWRAMPSRGSATADHYDHVHISVY